MRAALCVVLGLVILCAPAWSYELITREGTASLSADQRVDDDLLIAGEDVKVEGEVTGNLYAFGRAVDVRGPVGGSVVAAAQTVNWSGTAKGSVHLAGQTVQADGTTDGNLALAGQSVTVSDKARSGKELLAAGNYLTVAAAAAKGVRLAGQTVSFNGTTEGPLAIAAEQGRIGSRAVIGGDLTSYGRRRPTVEPGAQVRGVTRHIQTATPARTAQPRHRHPLRSFFFRFALWGVLSLFILWVAPRMLTEGAATIGSRPGATVGLGFAALVCAPAAVIILLVTVLGAWVALVLLAVYLTALALSGVFSSMFIGRKVLGPKRASWAALLVGVAIIAIGAMLPYVGWLVSLVAIVFGLGAEVLRLGGALSRQRPKPAPPPTPAPAEGTSAR